MQSVDSTLFTNFRLLTMCSGGQPYGKLSDQNVWVCDGKIAWTGHDEPTDLPAGTSIVDGHGKFLGPGLIDCHTHLVHGGNRADEWEQRLAGVPYEEIARQGGGILSTVAATRAASEDELFESARKRLIGFLQQGVTTVEIKSGYGLDLETELKMLRVARRLGAELPVDVSTTLLAAHAVPPEFRGRADDYVTHVCEEIIPAAVDLCDAVDVFCESIAFDIQQTERVLAAAAAHQLGIKVHAEQLTNLGGAALAAKMGAWSADHLEYLAADDCSQLAKANTVATLLPGAFYVLKETQRPPVAALRDAGVTIAIASDANPGSSPLSSILLVANMACTLYGLTAEESMIGLTRNAAAALRKSESIGTLEVGKQADLVVWDIACPAELPYGVGHNPCLAVYKSGQKTEFSRE